MSDQKCKNSMENKSTLNKYEFLRLVSLALRNPSSLSS